MDMLRRNFSEEPYKIIKERASYLKRWTQRCRELEQEEKRLHAGLDDHLKGVLCGKRLLVFKEMLAELQYPDKR